MVKEIELTQGQIALVDDEDYEWLSEFNWYAQRLYRYGNVPMFCGRTNLKGSVKRGYALMHRAVLEKRLGRRLLKGEEVDHINRNPLDNRSSNLRLATRASNSQNRRRTSNKVPYKGVSYRKRNGRFQAEIEANRQRYFLGYHDTSEEAARAYDKAARELHGEFAVLNFPEE